MTRIRLVFVVGLFCLSSTPLIAQDQSKGTSASTVPIEAKPTNCEFHVATLDAASSKAGKNSLVIAIARLGGGERRPDLNRRRLHNVRTYLITFDNRSPQTIITAQGERVSGYGRIELYVDGKLFYVLAIRPNADLAVGGCSFDGDDPCKYEREKKFYPCLGRNQRQ
jgi:hypothetical protein